MKNNKNLIAIVCIAILVCLYTLSCQKEEPPAVEGNVKFSVNVSLLKNVGILKSLSDVKTAVITIQKSDGQPTDYTSEELDVQHMNGILFTKKITLLSGNYQLTEFLLLDASGNTIYATPIEGSELAVHISDPLPIDFTVVKDDLTSVVVEVLETEGSIPDQFGMVSFTIVEVTTFKFKIGVIDNETNNVISATLRVTSGSYTFDEYLDSTLTNIVLVRDGFTNYSLSIMKDGYHTYTGLFSADSLKMYLELLNIPLIIELNPELCPSGDPVVDIDGNSYKTVTIGSQVWMAENLKTSRLNDGTEIPLKEEDAHWESPGPQYYAYCWYDNDSASYANPYGALYNFDAVETGDLCPDGWHVPSNTEWQTLINYLGGSAQAAIKLKEAGTAHWPSPNNGTNESCFTAVPAGHRHDEEGFYSIGVHSIFWTSTPDPLDTYWAYDVYLSNTIYVSTNQIGKGFSIRCVQD